MSDTDDYEKLRQKNIAERNAFVSICCVYFLKKPSHNNHYLFVLD